MTRMTLSELILRLHQQYTSPYNWRRISNHKQRTHDLLMIKSEKFEVRVDVFTWKAFLDYCASLKTNPSILLRNFIEGCTIPLIPYEAISKYVFKGFKKTTEHLENHRTAKRRPP